MTLLQEYKKALKDIALADEMMKSGIPEDVQIAVDVRARAMDTIDALEVFIGKAVDYYIESGQDA